MHAWLAALLGLLAIASVAGAAAPVDYVKDVKPILRARCYSCHGALQQKGKLRVDSGDLLRKGGVSGPAVRPDTPGLSQLLLRVAEKDPEERMPPEGQPLTDKEIATLKAWVEQGAKVPLNDKPEADPRDHWAFRKPVRPVIPAPIGKAWGGNPVDALLADKHREKGLTPNPPAGKAVLLRRVYLDLIGLPPTREEVAAFLADPAADAYEKVVDRLLTDPRYGERWARHWMDVWRYSDWYGRRAVPDVMNSYPTVWRWRDWIVASLNAGKGYDRMVAEMLAADELDPADETNVVATGFLVRNWFKWNYNNWMRDNVEHTGKAFLGLTMNCCHCHDHKYDPITQREYFRLRAVFEPLELRHDRVPGEPDPGPFKKYVYGVAYGPIASGKVRVFDEKPDAETFVYAAGDERNKTAGAAAVPPGVPGALGSLTPTPITLPPTAWYPGLKPFIRAEELAKRTPAVAAAETALKAGAPIPSFSNMAGWEDFFRARHVAEARLAVARADLGSVQARIAADDAMYLGGPGNADELAKAAAKAERQLQHATTVLALAQAEQALAPVRRKAAADTKAKPEADKLAAAAETARKQVDAAAVAVAVVSTEYTAFSPVYPKQSSGRRLALAKWITGPDNPLAARVAVNHLWRWHFGRALAEPTFDLGRNGKPPSNPALLDWLAVELQSNGWKMKPLHRLIVTSRAYRMDSSEPPAADARRAHDPDNVYLWRFPTARMEAEVVRDSVLYLAGELDPKAGGPEIPHEQGLTSHRRSLYFAYHGESKMGFLELFDAANPCDAYTRTASVTPQQALVLSNSELTLRSGRALARKLATAFPTDRAAFARAAFEQVLGRTPDPDEVAAAVRFLDRQVELLKSAPKPPAAGPSADPLLRAMEGLVVALFNHNDFVTIR
ncbi:PSD1 and planctomycete cytochrome C domain-containing protein [Fimbriiglobus ruber]|uniref:Cytochrome c domain-containing protein n=1 Tax=Fimbriiglobus ruber TaxID=1908690 RepID=A0A225D626_9BACT|nr:PSD1 and planctomycete cytochrome C domain-containing protein [Fimbriiglobus ruber]OWK36433.1 hypothetical protein FRUB_08996 [Fimbriiglobus ruber]